MLSMLPVSVEMLPFQHDPNLQEARMALQALGWTHEDLANASTPATCPAAPTASAALTAQPQSMHAVKCSKASHGDGFRC